MRNLLMFAVVSLVAMSGTLVRAGDKVDSPMYQSWAHFKPGSYSKLHHVVDSGGKTREFDYTSTLKSINDDKATVEIIVNMGDAPKPPHSQDISAKIDADDPKMPREVGKEDIKIGEKTYSCKVFEMKQTAGKSNILVRLWVSSDVPGGIAKMRSDIKNDKLSVTDEGELVDFQAK